MRRSDSEFDEYYAARALALRRTAYLIVRDWHAAEEITQAAFVKLYAAWSRVRPETLEAYTRRIVVNESLTYVKRRRREPVMASVPDGIEVDSGPEESTGVVERLHALSPTQRAVLALRFLEDLSVAQVADLLGVSQGTVKTQTSRGLSALRRQLANDPTNARGVT